MHSPPREDLSFYVAMADRRLACDPAGRLSRDPDASGRGMPRFYLGRTVLGNVWRFSSGVPRAVLVDLARWAGLERPLDPGGASRAEVPTPPERWPHVLSRLGVEGPAKSVVEAVLTPPDERARESGSAGRVIRVSEGNAHLLNPAFSRSLDAVSGGRTCFAKLLDGEIVSTCHTRRGESGGESQFEVFTRNRYRRCGHARDVVCDWAQSVREEGQVPIARVAFEDRDFLQFARRSRFTLWGEDRLVF